MDERELAKGRDFLKASEVYAPCEPVKKTKNIGYYVPHFDISFEESKAQGWHYKIKSGGKLRITHYTGTEREVVAPHSIGGHVTNEIGKEAFANVNADIIFLPDSVKEIGEGCFSNSSIRRAVLPESVRELPEKCFYSCRNLESVRFSEWLCSIGNRAFMYCEKLRFFDITQRMITLGDEIFRASGLEGFSMARDSAIRFNGSIFIDTPLHKNYSLIIAPIKDSMYNYRVLLVGAGKAVRFQKGSTVTFMEKSVHNECTLNLSECSSVNFEYGAFPCNRNMWGIVNSYTMAKVIMPCASREFVPHYVDAYYPGGSAYPHRSWFTDVRIDGDLVVMKPRKNNLHEYCFTDREFKEHKIGNIMIDCGTNWLEYETNAFSCTSLRSVTIKDNLYGKGELFSGCCYILGKVTIGQYTVYIPTVSHRVHGNLLKAFRDKGYSRPCRYFDSSIYDRIFTESPKVWSGVKAYKRLSQKELITIAAAVMMSSPTLFENRDMYEKYLRTHKRYALLICDKLPDEYSDFLIKYYGVEQMANARRGFMPTDERDFSDNSLPVLRRAAEEVLFLQNRGYMMTNATRFVGDHYQLSERQRLALARTISPLASIVERKSRQVTDISGETIYIDGFNVIIGLEIACSQSMLFKCMDGTVRDLAGLHGTYRLIPQTDEGIKMLIKALSELRVSKAVIYLDKPVSNSGRLKQRIYELAEDIPFELEVLTEDAVDSILKTKPIIASADAIILDECSKWFNLNRYIVDTYIGSYPYVDIVPSFE
ncbi:DUF434 domain-containing protein [Ruminococcus sp.]|uniref:DUF434 domain-containing protein n=1 Tax=Ruminococcus sp. TaxID=41978 RepID=UPI0025F104BB|nr:DUF434 domain-containing protein [Ruminococcus sp.]